MGETSNEKIMKENGEKTSQIEVEPMIDNLQVITKFIEKILEDKGANAKLIASINIAIDEIFSNIVYYSEASKVVISCRYDGNQAYIRFVDDGKPYNPLEKEDPDTTLLAEERKIGGLGIYIVKNMMEGMTYHFINQKNVLECKTRKDLSI